MKNTLEWRLDVYNCPFCRSPQEIPILVTTPKSGLSYCDISGGSWVCTSCGEEISFEDIVWED